MTPYGHRNKDCVFVVVFINRNPNIHTWWNHLESMPFSEFENNWNVLGCHEREHYVSVKSRSRTTYQTSHRYQVYEKRHQCLNIFRFCKLKNVQNVKHMHCVTFCHCIARNHGNILTHLHYWTGWDHIFDSNSSVLHERSEFKLIPLSALDAPECRAAIMNHDTTFEKV